MDYKNFINFMLVESSNSLIESLNLNRECTPSVITSLSIHIGSVFASQDWRVLSSSMVDNKNDDISQRLIMSPKDMLEYYIVLDICLFKQSSHWESILNYDENTTLIKESANHVMVGIAEGNSLISESLKCEDTLILPPSETDSRRILWHIK